MFLGHAVPLDLVISLGHLETMQISYRTCLEISTRNFATAAPQAISKIKFCYCKFGEMNTQPYNNAGKRAMANAEKAAKLAHLSVESATAARMGLP